MKIIIKGNIFNLSVLWNNNIVIRHVIEKIIPYPPYLVCGNKYNHVKIGKVNIIIIKKYFFISKIISEYFILFKLNIIIKNNEKIKK